MVYTLGRTYASVVRAHTYRRAPIFICIYVVVAYI